MRRKTYIDIYTQKFCVLAMPDGLVILCALDEKEALLKRRATMILRPRKPANCTHGTYILCHIMYMITLCNLKFEGLC